MFTMTDFISLVEDNMSFTSFEVTQPSEQVEQAVIYYEDYKASNFHNYKVQLTHIDGEELVTLFIYADGMDDHIEEVIIPDGLEHAFEVLKDYDDRYWSAMDDQQLDGMII